MRQKSAFRFLPLFALLSLVPLSGYADAVKDLIDLPGTKWRVSSPLTSRMEKHSGKKPLRITVHFTDVPKNFDRPLTQKLRILFKFATETVEGAKKKLWGDIPYHFYIDADGKLAEARDPAYMPDSNTSYDRDGHITIVLEGDLKDGMTGPQKKKMNALIQALQEKYRIPTARVKTHKDYAQTDCPGPVIFRAVEDYKESRRDLK